FALAWFPVAALTETALTETAPGEGRPGEATGNEPAPDGPYPQWRPLIEHTPGQRLTDVEAFAAATVVSLRRDGLTALRVLPATGEPYDISFPEPIHTVALSENPE